MDILAIRKDGKELLVVELKRGRVSDVVVGQVQRYMGYVTEVLSDKHQSVGRAIIGLEDDLNLRGFESLQAHLRAGVKPRTVNKPKDILV